MAEKNFEFLSANGNVLRPGTWVHLARWKIPRAAER